MLLDADCAQLLIVDVQERLLPAMADPQGVVEGCAKLMRAAPLLSVPILVSEQYPKGLGPTVAELAALVPPECVRDKIAFSCFADEGLRQALEARKRRQVVIGGIEAHVCVLQTALMLSAGGFDVFVAADAVSSRSPDSVDLAMGRLRAAGVSVVNSEMVLFEWVERAGTDTFKQISRLVR